MKLNKLALRTEDTVIGLDFQQFNPYKPFVVLTHPLAGKVLMNIRGVRPHAFPKALNHEDVVSVCSRFGPPSGISNDAAAHGWSLNVTGESVHWRGYQFCRTIGGALSLPLARHLVDVVPV